MRIPSPEGEPEDAVRAYFAAGDQHSSRLLRIAFHPAALMHWLDKGAVRELTQIEWWQRLEAPSPAPPALERRLTLLDRERNLALIEADSRWADHRFVDLIAVARTPAGWRIAGKVFQSLERETEAHRDPADEDRIREVLAGKFRARAEFSHALLLETHLPQCRYFRVGIDGIPFTWETLSEGAARYAAASEAGKNDLETKWRILEVFLRGDVAAAKIDSRDGDGLLSVDEVLLVRTPGGWRISSVAWGR